MSNKNNIKEFAKLIAKLENYVIHVLKAEPSEQQLDVIRAIDEGEKNIAIKSGHGTGKSALLSWIALWAGVTKLDCKVPLTAPSYPQLVATLIPEIRKWNNAHPDVLKKSIKIKSEQVDFANGNFILARTARKEQPEAMQGFHATNLWFLMDEASGIHEVIFEVIDGALTGKLNVRIMTGNPTRTSGYFYDAFHKNKELWKTFTFNAEDSKNVSKESIDRKRKQYGEDSDIYRVRVKGEFPRASSNSVFSVSELEDAFSRKENEVDKVGAEVWGLDVARYGDDKSVLVKRKHRHVYYIEKRDNLDTMEVAQWVHYEYTTAKNKPAMIFVDIIGIGAGVYDKLAHLGVPVYGANAASRASSNEYTNKRSEMYHNLKKVIGYISITAEDEELRGELGALEYKIEGNGKISLAGKDEVKRRLGRSPDTSDALSLSFFEDINCFEDEIKKRDGVVETEYKSYTDGTW